MLLFKSRFINTIHNLIDFRSKMLSLMGKSPANIGSIASSTQPVSIPASATGGNNMEPLISVSMKVL